jgi:hypothetical protein
MNSAEAQLIYKYLFKSPSVLVLDTRHDIPSYPLEPHLTNITRNPSIKVTMKLFTVLIASAALVAAQKGGKSGTGKSGGGLGSLFGSIPTVPSW